MSEFNKEKTAIITGGAKGIGFEYCIGLLERGNWRIAIFDLDLAAIDDAILRLREAFPGCYLRGYECDVSFRSSFRAAFDSAVNDFDNQLDLLINNAGIIRYMFSDSEKTLFTNLFGVICGTEYAVKFCTDSFNRPAVGADGLIVVNTASTNGLIPADCDFAPVYVATKFGIVGFTRSLKMLHSRFNIRVNCICPVTVDTPMVTSLITPEVIDFLNKEDRGGIMSPKICAEALLRIIDDNHLSGEVITVHPSNPIGGKVEPLDPFEQFKYLGKWRETDSEDIRHYVDAAFQEVKVGNITAWSEKENK